MYIPYQMNILTLHPVAWIFRQAPKLGLCCLAWADYCLIHLSSLPLNLIFVLLDSLYHLRIMTSATFERGRSSSPLLSPFSSVSLSHWSSQDCPVIIANTLPSGICDDWPQGWSAGWTLDPGARRTVARPRISTLVGSFESSRSRHHTSCVFQTHQ